MKDIDIDAAQCKYTLLVDKGAYFSDSLFGNFKVDDFDAVYYMVANQEVD